MIKKNRSRRTWAGALVVAVCGTVVGLGGCASPAEEEPAGPPTGVIDTSTASGDITYWSWTPGIEPLIEEFERTHPDIHVTLVNAGQGDPAYAKLRTAMKAGSGVPDVMHVTLDTVASFGTEFLDLREYGASEIADRYLPFALEFVSQEGAIRGLPTDTGPMGIVYRKSIFDQYGIEVPQTWDEFADAARKLHAANPDVFITNLAPNESGPILSLSSQAGSRPFQAGSETELQIALNDPGAKQFAEYWEPLVAEGVVSVDPAYTDTWYKSFADGRYASWITAAWGPVFLQGIVADTAGDWRAALLPQWEAGQNISANFGGSAAAVPRLAPNKPAAAEFAKWYASAEFVAKWRAENKETFPAIKAYLEDPEIVDRESAFFGGQQVVKDVFLPSSQMVPADYQFSPFQDYVSAQISAIIGGALTQGGSLTEAFDTLQETVVQYATDQGYTVTTR
ncbi:MAG: extracellular solute-binding protein [Bifidobacteriaceae bacterium]|jgi:multiple sugar transport system substrate-binding protein|nr:extracellular solute-binding protein [Bifidobacteriaceae bacterium]